MCEAYYVTVNKMKMKEIKIFLKDFSQILFLLFFFFFSSQTIITIKMLREKKRTSKLN